MKPELKLKIHKFLKKYGKLILTIIVALFAIYTINKIVISVGENNKVPVTSYEPNITIMSSEKTPSKVQKTTENFIEEFVEYCNNKQYEKAYNMLSNECREEYYTTLESFKYYVNSRYGTEKIYSLQSYSIYNDKYIYSLRLYDNLLATGLTNSSYMFQEEKIIASYDENKNVVFSIGDFVDKEEIKSVQENDYLKIDVRNKIINYNYELYKVKFTNRSQDIIVIQDGKVEEPEVLLDIGEETRENKEENNIIIYPGESKEYNLSFVKFFDDGDTSKKIIFNNIRVMEQYNPDIQITQDDINNSKDKFSMELGL